MAASGSIQVSSTPETLRQVVKTLQSGDCSVHERVERQIRHCLDLEPTVRAWVQLDVRGALARAEQLDAMPWEARQAMPLFGLTIGIKDIIDTADLPTELGTPLHAGRHPSDNAEIVQTVLAAGAVILGKTVTTELATYAPGPTRNPWSSEYSPGGSSSGSAAATACAMSDLAIGTQTNGSTIRPASYCGVVGFKPSRNLLSRTGILCQSPSFDAVGLFGRTTDDVAYFFEAATGLSTRSLHDLSATTRTATSDPQNRNRGDQELATGNKLWHASWWDVPCMERLSTSAMAFWTTWRHSKKISSLADTLWTDWSAVTQRHTRIMEAEIARAFADEYARGASQISASLRGQIERGRALSDSVLAAERSELARQKREIDAQWPEGVEFLLLPSSTGTAPLFGGGTGDPIFCTWASALDLPAINIPIASLSSADPVDAADRAEDPPALPSLPIGLQIIARRGADESLLRFAAQWENLSPGATR